MNQSFLFVLLLLSFIPAQGQLNAELLHQLVEHSKDEYKRQLDARDHQASNAALEQINKEQTAKLKTSYRIICGRFQSLNSTLQLLQTGLESTPLVNEIIINQKKIIDLALQRLDLSFFVLQSEKDILAKSAQLSRYIAALFITIGEFNQMKMSDRRVLYGHIISELRIIAGASAGLARLLASPRTNRKKEAIFFDQTKSDKRIVESLLNQAAGGEE